MRKILTDNFYTGPKASLEQHKIKLRLGSPHSTGFSLPVVVGASVLILGSSLALVIAATNAQEGASRQYQSRLAREIAEAGTATTIDELNTDHRYLLVENLSQWSNLTLKPTTVCPGSNVSTASMPKSGDIASSSSGGVLGSYAVLDYNFVGNRNYGGTGKLRVQGTLKNQSGQVIATSVVNHHLDVRPKNCGGTFNTPPTSSGFPGLTANTMNLGNNDVLGAVNGNILCIDCAGEDLSKETSQLRNSIVNGTFFSGSISLPPIPEPPSGFPSSSTNITNTTTITAGSTNGGACAVDSGVTSCRIGRINLKGKQSLTVNTSRGGSVRLYLYEDINISGNTRLIHNNSPEKLSIFGMNTSIAGQSITISGGSSAINAFIQAPNARVGINGGSSNPDFVGTIWAKEFDGSSSNNVELVIPDDMGRRLTTEFGDTFNVSLKDFSAAGTSFWSAHSSQ